MVVRISDKKNYGKVTKLLVTPNLINIFLFQVVVYGILFSVENISTKGKINIGNKVSMTFR